MEKIDSVIPDNTIRSNNNDLLGKEETTIYGVRQSLEKLSDDAREALKYLNDIKNANLPLVNLETGIEESRENIKNLFDEGGNHLAEKMFELLNTTGEVEIGKFVKKCGLSLEKLELKFPKSSEAVNYDGWSAKTVNLEMINGSPSSVTAEATAHVSLGMLPKTHTGFYMELETKPLVEKEGPSVEFRINSGNNIDGEYSLSNAVISFMNTKKIYPDIDILDTNCVGGVVLRPDGGIFSIFINDFDEKGGSKHILSTESGFYDSLRELEGVLGRHGIFLDHIPSVIDIAESFNYMARGHMGGERLMSIVPKNLFEYEGGILKNDRKSFDWNKIRNLFNYDLSRRIDEFTDKINNPESMLGIEEKSLGAELQIYENSISFFKGDLSPSNVTSFLSWISLSFSNETGGKDITTTPEDAWYLSKTEQDLVMLFFHLKNVFLYKPEKSE